MFAAPRKDFSRKRFDGPVTTNRFSGGPREADEFTPWNPLLVDPLATCWILSIIPRQRALPPVAYLNAPRSACSWLSISVLELITPSSLLHWIMKTAEVSAVKGRGEELKHLSAATWLRNGAGFSTTFFSLFSPFFSLSPFVSVNYIVMESAALIRRAPPPRIFTLNQILLQPCFIPDSSADTVPR